MRHGPFVVGRVQRPVAWHGPAPHGDVMQSVDEFWSAGGDILNAHKDWWLWLASLYGTVMGRGVFLNTHRERWFLKRYYFRCMPLERVCGLGADPIRGGHNPCSCLMRPRVVPGWGLANLGTARPGWAKAFTGHVMPVFIPIFIPSHVKISFLPLWMNSSTLVPKEKFWSVNLTVVSNPSSLKLCIEGFGSK